MKTFKKTFDFYVTDVEIDNYVHSILQSPEVDPEDEIDIALDTFPYNGVTTTFEALAMGVPVITMKGYNFNSRCGESIIKNLGIVELIANDEDDYILKAQKIANDKDKLLELRKNIFNISHETPLFDTKQFSQDFFGILEKI